MLPSPDILNDFEHGRFVLSNLAAKRAKQLREGAMPLVSVESNHPLTIAGDRIEDFADFLGALRDAGTRDLAFVIGGPDGLGVLPGKKSGRSLAFGPQTWPHLLARAMLAEQVYRAITILAGHPYHRA